jgi:hypothetical protein
MKDRKFTNKKTLARLFALSSNHMELMESGLVELAGCFDCGVRFFPSRIEEYIEEFGEDAGYTARCPNCGTDSVIPVRLADNVLDLMNEYCFGSAPAELSPERNERLAYLRTLLFGDDDLPVVLKPTNGIIH